MTEIFDGTAPMTGSADDARALFALLSDIARCVSAIAAALRARPGLRDVVVAYDFSDVSIRHGDLRSPCLTAYAEACIHVDGRRLVWLSTLELTATVWSLALTIEQSGDYGSHVLRDVAALSAATATELQARAVPALAAFRRSVEDALGSEEPP